MKVVVCNDLNESMYNDFLILLQKPIFELSNLTSVYKFTLVLIHNPYRVTWE